MKLPAPLWRYWQAIWPVDYQANVQVNISGCIRYRQDEDEDIFCGTRWIGLVLQTRGNGLFLCQPSESGCVDTEMPNIAWVIEHIHLEIRPVKSLLTLPDGVKHYNQGSGYILYLCNHRDDDNAFLAIYFHDYTQCQWLYEYLRRCSLSYHRSLQKEHHDDIVHACEAIHALESLRYNHDNLLHQKNMIRMDNTLLLSQYTANKQAFSECSEMQMHENAGLKAQLKKNLEHIMILEESKAALEDTVRSLKSEKARLIRKNADLESKVNEARTSDASSDNIDRHSRSQDIAQLTCELHDLQKEHARIVNVYNSYKNQVNMEFERMEDFLYHGTIFEMMMHWIRCNDLKVEYYETCHQMSPEEHYAFSEKIQCAQGDFRTHITLARACYINCRTHLLNDMIGSIDNPKMELPLSRRFLTMALQRLSWMFQTDSSNIDLRDTLWMNQERLDGMIERAIYNNMDHSWYNKLCYLSALKPILTNDAASDSALMTLKRQLCEALGQNENLKNQVAMLQKMIGSNAHWKQVWTRAVE